MTPGQPIGMSMTSCNYVSCHSCNGSQDPFFNKTMFVLTRKSAAKLSPHCYYPSMTCPIPRFVSNRAYLGSFGMGSWTSQEFERTRGKVT
ncbi:uncharacterized protein TNCV_669151 [Trichonephila clavipes]|nr:uncharacterized protein TNCV_669151 [Trichonephila clavipes]